MMDDQTVQDPAVQTDDQQAAPADSAPESVEQEQAGSDEQAQA